jgi:predicted NBD/HSP70 family sugar kinase
MRVMSFDMGGTRLKAAVVDVPGRGPFSLYAAEPSGLDAVAVLGARLLAEAEAEVEVEGVPDMAAMCVPGLVDEAGVVRVLPGKLPGVEGLDVRAWLVTEFGLPVGAVVNDAAAFGWAEASARPERRRVLTVTVGTGLGTALVDNKTGEVRGLLTGQLYEETCRAGHVTVDGLVEALVGLAFAHEPEVLVVGGGAAPTLEGVADAVNNRLAPWLSVEVEAAVSGDGGGVLGAALLSLDGA